jgi:hypothetical protein
MECIGSYGVIVFLRLDVYRGIGIFERDIVAMTSFKTATNSMVACLKQSRIVRLGDAQDFADVRVEFVACSVMICAYFSSFHRFGLRVVCSGNSMLAISRTAAS